MRILANSGRRIWLTLLLFVSLTLAQIWRTPGDDKSDQRQSYVPNDRHDGDHRARPNFVFLITDDQELVPGGINHGMRYTLPMMRQSGTTLRNFFANTPICCPSRATLLTGRYPHRWFVPSDDACMYMDVAGDDFAQASMGVLMQRLGYTTGCFGKTLNLEIGTPYCNESTVKAFPGWDSSFALCNEFDFEENVWNVNGSILRTTDYMTSVIGNRSLSFIESNLRSGKPFFAYIGVHAPHLPSTPAPWYKDEFPSLSAPRPPNYNFHGSTHHYLVRSQPPLTEDVQSAIDELYRDRQRSLLSVDDIMHDVINLLSRYGQLETTYVVWTSDHGYQLGQFRLPAEKEQPYEHVIRVPFFIRGPCIPEGSTLPFVASMVDVLPTLIELAGGAVPASMDGHSFARPLLLGGSSFRERHLVEYWSVPRMPYYDHLIDMENNTFIGVRLLNATHSYLYVEYYAHRHEQNFVHPIECELFDLKHDPWQLQNVCGLPEAHSAGPLRSVLRELRHHLHSQVKCSGQDECVL